MMKLQCHFGKKSLAAAVKERRAGLLDLAEVGFLTVDYQGVKFDCIFLVFAGKLRRFMGGPTLA